ncbi:hypothetical protein AB0E01_22830 [Nocardia vinacea]|uniref:hypothetical protein n=1 Tax=Nocardia vinacea TaxID=96468 RepID=UPI0033D9BEDA
MSSDNAIPTIGRMVHYQTLGTRGGEYLPAPTAAIVTGVEPGNAADLFVIYPNGTSHKQMVPWSDEPTPGHWNWPPRNN